MHTAFTIPPLTTPPPAPQTSPYVLSRIHLLRDPDPALSQRRAVLLSFLSALLGLHGTGRPTFKVEHQKGGMEALARRYQMRRELLQELLDLFYNHRCVRACMRRPLAP